MGVSLQSSMYRKNSTAQKKCTEKPGRQGGLGKEADFV